MHLALVFYCSVLYTSLIDLKDFVMILNNAPAHEAVLSNVGEIGEFRIRNSAKAFSILSSGLYANKIRAIIRELSCNAVDSHVAAGKSDVAFDIHIPNSLEPWFSIRDYGTGLSHEQVSQIYTTYFESTKTNSNAFIGALGLGSKSPFSYTDNFTVTAIQGGKKGIYSAFINGEGVPSIAMMMSEDTDEPSGVEIKMSVNESRDYSKFREEAQHVYQHFTLKPNVSGCAGLTFDPLAYETRDLIPGVHIYHKTNFLKTVAVMGNIAYPINVPNEKQALGNLHQLLSNSLEIHFDIGELDFQASREGLSYIPSTINAIRSKLQQIKDALGTRLTADADAIPNYWDRAAFLHRKMDTDIWQDIVIEYIQKTKFPAIKATTHYWDKTQRVKFVEDDLAETYNISLRSFNVSNHNPKIHNNKPVVERNITDGVTTLISYWEIPIENKTRFVVNDTKVGATTRAQYHYRNDTTGKSSGTYFVLEKADPNKEMQAASFFADIYNPPETYIVKASELSQKPRKSSSVGKNVSLLTLKTRRRGYNEETIWTSAGNLSDKASTETYYYVSLTGFTMNSQHYSDAKDLLSNLHGSGIPAFEGIQLYGVRKSDLAAVKALSNWVDIEDHIKANLTTVDDFVVYHMARYESVHDIMFDFMLNPYNRNELIFADSLISDESPFKQFYAELHSVLAKSKNSSLDYNKINVLHSLYGDKTKYDLQAIVGEKKKFFSDICNRYPLLSIVGRGKNVSAPVAEYINLIDNSKGI